MKKIAFVFMDMPHGNSSSREGLDALLATAAFTENIGVFFISDAVCQLLICKDPKKILTHNYVLTYKLLPLYYSINNFYLSFSDLKRRGFLVTSNFVLPVSIISNKKLKTYLTTYDVILTF